MHAHVANMTRSNPKIHKKNLEKIPKIPEFDLFLFQSHFMNKMVISCENDCLSEKWYRMSKLSAVFQKLSLFIFFIVNYCFYFKIVFLLGYGHFICKMADFLAKKGTFLQKSHEIWTKIPKIRIEIPKVFFF